MFAPVIAYLILFNDYVFDFLSQVPTNLGISPAEEVSITNIYFIYYGPILIGVASILYVIVCPMIVYRSPDSISYSYKIDYSGSKAFIISIFDDILKKFINNDEISQEKELLDYPEDIRMMTSHIVVEIYKKYLEVESVYRNDDSEHDNDQDNRWLDFHDKFVTGSGYFSAEAIAESAYAAPKVIWAFSEPYRSIAANEFSSDIAFVKYEIDNYSRPIIRFSCALLYFIGFILLFVPSANTLFGITFKLLTP